MDLKDMKKKVSAATTKESSVLSKGTEGLPELTRKIAAPIGALEGVKAAGSMLINAFEEETR